jgi:hypothetical protein
MLNVILKLSAFTHSNTLYAFDEYEGTVHNRTEYG